MNLALRVKPLWLCYLTQEEVELSFVDAREILQQQNSQRYHGLVDKLDEFQSILRKHQSINFEIYVMMFRLIICRKSKNF